MPSPKMILWIAGIALATNLALAKFAAAKVG
jgi:hypothetical protein